MKAASMKTWVPSVFLAAFCLCAQGQDTQAKDTRGLPPRATPADYQAQGKAGAVTVGAEFVGHSVPTPEGILSTEDYVVVEVGMFGPNTPLKIFSEDFSLRI